jgi:histidyl-tRNA synthetase
LSTDRDLVEAIELAKAHGLASIAVVHGSLETPNAITLHHLASSTRAESSAADLVRLARAEAEGRRR